MCYNQDKNNFHYPMTRWTRGFAFAILVLVVVIIIFPASRGGMM